PNDEAGGGNHAISALAACETGIFLDPVDRHFRRAPEHREYRPIAQEIDGVIAPFAGGYLAAIEIEDAVEFAAGEGDLLDGGDGRHRARIFAPAGLARFGIAGPKAHAAPPMLCPNDRAR